MYCYYYYLMQVFLAVQTQSTKISSQTLTEPYGFSLKPNITSVYQSDPAPDALICSVFSPYYTLEERFRPTHSTLPSLSALYQLEPHTVYYNYFIPPSPSHSFAL